MKTHDCTAKLLDFDSRDAVELLGDSRRVVLGHVFLQWLGRSVDQVLGFLQAKSGDFAYSLDGVDLVRAGILQDDGELGLLFCCRGSRADACCRSRSNRNSSRHAEALFKLLPQL